MQYLFETSADIEEIGELRPRKAGSAKTAGRAPEPTVSRSADLLGSKGTKPSAICLPQATDNMRSDRRHGQRETFVAKILENGLEGVCWPNPAKTYAHRHHLAWTWRDDQPQPSLFVYEQFALLRACGQRHEHPGPFFRHVMHTPAPAVRQLQQRNQKQRNDPYGRYLGGVGQAAVG